MPMGRSEKNQKSKPLQKVIQQPQYIASYTAVVDVGMIWRLATPIVDDRIKGDGSPCSVHCHSPTSTAMMLVLLSVYVMLSIRRSMLVCAAASLFCACLVSVQVSAPYVSTLEAAHGSCTPVSSCRWQGCF